VHGFRIAVHRVTGEISILQSVHAADAGTVINPMQLRAQIEGSVAQAVGWSLYERMVFDEEGRVVNPTFRNYRIPAFADTPRTEVYFADTQDAVGPLGRRAWGNAPSTPSRLRWPTHWPMRPASASATSRSRPIGSTAVSSNVTWFDDCAPS